MSDTAAWLWLSLALLAHALAQLGDIWSTNLCRAHAGWREKSRLNQWAMLQYGALWWWPKAALALLLALVCGVLGALDYAWLGAALMTFASGWTATLGVFGNYQWLREH